MKHAIIWVNVKDMPRAKANQHTKNVLDMIKGWAPKDVKWLAMPIRDENAEWYKIDFMDF